VNPNDSQQIQFRGGGSHRFFDVGAGYHYLALYCGLYAKRMRVWDETDGRVRFNRYGPEEAEIRPFLRGDSNSNSPPKYEEIETQ
jgi:hypothetical protein